jgi:hypothetical protein
VGKLLGLLLIATVVGLAYLAWRTPSPRARGTFAAAAILLWFVACIAFATLLGFEMVATGGTPATCTGHHVDDSDGAPSRWSWLPPGQVCEYPSGDSGPTYWRIPALAVLLVLPPFAAAKWPTRPMGSPHATGAGLAPASP